MAEYVTKIYKSGTHLSTFTIRFSHKRTSILECIYCQVERDISP